MQKVSLRCLIALPPLALVRRCMGTVNGCDRLRVKPRADKQPTRLPHTTSATHIEDVQS